ncbi:hypothetical protein GCM10007301_19330 [Azorhizobium oxalatiphilum]|uniref:Uncharacterized protein n=1 Tax=Azorhizobium oxalatiphilum TaxID=980631 RepID=A0A917FBG7_9HYPH|nr:hypothetical protein [Azorhizobium oxalatiphilum]GGF59721.1 hypothetical protein GCM10007301_19330 [Azorhizobium oxalatiphilum]
MKTLWGVALAALVLGAGPSLAADFNRPAYAPRVKAPTCAQGCQQPSVVVQQPQQQAIIVQAPPPVPVAPEIIIAPPTAPLVYAAPGPVLFYPQPPRYYGPPPIPGPISGGVQLWNW